MRNIAEAAFRHRRLWMLVVLTVLVMALAYTVLRPKEYRSEMDILLQNTRGDEQITPSRINGTITINGVTEEQINSGPSRPKQPTSKAIAQCQSTKLFSWERGSFSSSRTQPILCRVRLTKASECDRGTLNARPFEEALPRT
jgi:hypothetical protein